MISWPLGDILTAGLAVFLMVGLWRHLGRRASEQTCALV